MSINVNTFIWINEPEANAKPETITTDKPLADDFANTQPHGLPAAEADDDFVYLAPDKSLLVEKSQYIEDMMGTEPEEDINKEEDSTKKE